MKRTRSGLTGVVTGVILASAFDSAIAQNDISIETYSCREILREAGPERDVAVAFIHGYILGKAGASKLQIAALRKQTSMFIERCLDNPQASALESMLKSNADKHDAGRSP
jgi:hypothetical protein